MHSNVIKRVAADHNSEVTSQQTSEVVAQACPAENYHGTHRLQGTSFPHGPLLRPGAEGVLLVRKAGEGLYRLRHQPARAGGETNGIHP